jgi:hypothetical protein
MLLLSERPERRTPNEDRPGLGVPLNPRKNHDQNQDENQDE